MTLALIPILLFAIELYPRKPKNYNTAHKIMRKNLWGKK